jgi:hypothetical protein
MRPPGSGPDDHSMLRRHSLAQRPLLIGLGVLSCLALSGCGSDSADVASKADTSATTTTGARATTTTNSPSTTMTGDADRAVSQTPTTAPGSSSQSGNSSQITFKNICDFATGAEMSAATGVAGLVGRSSGVGTEDDAASCTYDNPSAPTTAGVAFLAYDASDMVSYSQQPNDHGLHGFELKAPSAEDVQFGIAHPGMGRGTVTLSWVYASHPVHLRMNETAADGAKTIAEAQQINSKFPPE